MRKNLVYLAIMVSTVVIMTGVVFFVKKDSAIDVIQPKPEESVTSNNQEKETLEPPSGYDVLIDNKPATMSDSLRKSLKSKFNEIVERLKADPSNSALWADLGSIKYSFNDFDGAEKAWKYAIKINPLADTARMSLAALYQYKAPNYPEAEKMLRFVIENNPPRAMPAYSELFDLYRYRYTEKANLAEGVMLEAYRTFPNEHTILKALAFHFLEKGDKKKATEYFEKFLAKVPNDVSAKEELDRLKK